MNSIFTSFVYTFRDVTTPAFHILFTAEIVIKSIKSISYVSMGLSLLKVKMERFHLLFFSSSNKSADMNNDL